MKFKLSILMVLSVFILASSAKAQTSQPASGSTKTEIPVISIGNQVKPTKSGEEKTEKAEKTDKKEKPATSKKSVERAPKVARIDTVPLELKQTIYSRKSQVGNEVTFIVAENVPSKGVPVLSRGTPVIGKISAIEKPAKKNPGKLVIAFDHIVTASGGSVPFTATVELVSQQDKGGSYGKEIFMPAGFKQSVAPSSVVKSAGRPQKLKSTKGTLTAKAEVSDISIRVNDGKLPGKIEVYVEPPTGMKVTDLKDDSLKLVRVNDFALLKPLNSDAGNAKVGDFNKNNIQDLKFVFDGWELSKYLPAGSSVIVFSGMTKAGKPIEATGHAKVEFK